MITLWDILPFSFKYVDSSCLFGSCFQLELCHILHFHDIALDRMMVFSLLIFDHVIRICLIVSIESVEGLIFAVEPLLFGLELSETKLILFDIILGQLVLDLGVAFILRIFLQI